MSCTIRKATPHDLPRIREIYEMARQFMRKNGNHSQWGKGDEPEALIEEDIRQGNLYVLMESTNDTAEIAAEPTLLTIMVSAVPMIEFNNCSSTTGISRFRIMRFVNICCCCSIFLPQLPHKTIYKIHRRPCRL